MNRVAKKCMITSAALHGLLVVILLGGSAFFTSHKNEPAPVVLQFVKASDLPGAGGGNPNATPPPPPPPPVDPTPPTPPTPPPHADPPPVKKEEIKTPDPIKPRDSVKPPVKDPVIPTPLKHQVKVNNTLVKRTTNDVALTQAQKERAERAERAAAATRAAAAQRTALAGAFRNSATTLRDNLSKATTIDTFGPGNEAYANYGLIVRDKYDRAWLVSDALGDEDSTVKVSVLIARDGTVLSARISKSSGVPALDKSVQKTLNDVKTIAPFPEGAKDHERRFDINFNLKAKRLSA